MQTPVFPLDLRGLPLSGCRWSMAMRVCRICTIAFPLRNIPPVSPSDSAATIFFSVWHMLRIVPFSFGMGVSLVVGDWYDIHDNQCIYSIWELLGRHIDCHVYHINPPQTNDTPIPKLNGNILNISQTLKNIVAAESEGETGGMFLNGEAMVPIWHTLIAMDHPQPDNGNPLKSDRKTGVCIVCYFINTKRSKSLDMRYHWLDGHTIMGHLNAYWLLGIHNWAEIFTKHHPPAYHNIIR